MSTTVTCIITASLADRCTPHLHNRIAQRSLQNRVPAYLAYECIHRSIVPRCRSCHCTQAIGLTADVGPVLACTTASLAATQTQQTARASIPLIILQRQST